jgi:23S rRNA (cytosine1962-C5)-methyltransferase
VLNLFAYSGGASLAAARAGAEVCHLDASRKMVTWARRNAELNGLVDAPIRWIVDDVRRFLKREQRRGRRYDGIILDPPSFGRGKRQEVFKIDDHLGELLDQCREVLSSSPRFVFLSCHTPGYTPLVLTHLLEQMQQGCPGDTESGEMILPGVGGVRPVPSGSYAVWRGKGGNG